MGIDRQHRGPRKVEAEGDPIEQLVREHDNVAVLLVLLDSYFAALKAGDETDDTLLLDAVAYLTEFVQDVHHTKEDLAAEVGAEGCAPLVAVRLELMTVHARVRERGARVRALLEGALFDTPMSRDELADGGFAYTAEVRRSIAFEEARLFPRLSVTLDAGGWSRIRGRLGASRDPLFGDVTDPRYARLLEEITERVAEEAGTHA
jgi:hemerythrin-like domain-containing protein